MKVVVVVVVVEGEGRGFYAGPHLFSGRKDVGAKGTREKLLAIKISIKPPPPPKTHVRSQ